MTVPVHQIVALATGVGIGISLFFYSVLRQLQNAERRACEGDAIELRSLARDHDAFRGQLTAGAVYVPSL